MRRAASATGEHRVALADHARGEAVFQVEEAIALALHHPRDGDAGAARDDLRHVRGADFARHQRLRGGVARFQIGLLLQQALERAVADLGGAGHVAARVGGVQLRACAGDGGACGGERGGGLALLVPARGEGVHLRGAPGDLVRQGGRVGLGGGLQAAAQAGQVALAAVDLLRARLGLHADARGGLVQHVERLVGEAAVAQVAARQADGGIQRGGGDGDAVVRLVVARACRAASPARTRRPARPPGCARSGAPGRHPFDALAELVVGGGADAAQLAARESGLQQVGGIHPPRPAARARPACAARPGRGRRRAPPAPRRPRP
jgi:hypothetical protein